MPVIVAEHLLAPLGTGWRRIVLWWNFLAGGALSVGLEAAVYRWVERPAVVLGRRWSGQREPEKAAVQADAD